jgi:hypothetical protein
MIEELKKVKQFFEISVASFDFQRKIVEALGKEMKESKMEKQHRLILTELKKEPINVDFVISILSKMEKLVDENKKQKFEIGGVKSNSEQIVKPKLKT